MIISFFGIIIVKLSIVWRLTAYNLGSIRWPGPDTRTRHS